MKLIIAGGRDFQDYALLCKTMEQFNPDLVLCGGATGADALGDRWAKENGIPVDYYPADWAKHGKAAGPIRNTEMASNATHLLAFHDRRSRGTAHMIAIAHDCDRKAEGVDCTGR
jgi:YspA, cpYpsA-related SLOG family